MRVSVLRSLVQSLQRACPNNRILTPVHAEVMRLSLCIVKTSGSLVEEVYTRYAVRGSYLAFLGKCCPACASEYVLFYWYAGKIALSMGRYGEAVRLLRLVVSSPREVCFGTSEVQVSAFRLLVISSLVSEGSFSEELLLGTISEVAQRINDTCREYIKLEKVFSKGNIGAFEGYITENSEVWKRDGTEELIGVLRSSFFRHKIVRFSRIYSSANFSDVARYIGIQGGDSAVIIALIADAKSAGVVNAEIDASGCTVAFRDSQQKNVGDIDEKTSSLVVLSGTATRVKHAVIIRDFDETVNNINKNVLFMFNFINRNLFVGITSNMFTKLTKISTKHNIQQQGCLYEIVFILFDLIVFLSKNKYWHMVIGIIFVGLFLYHIIYH